MKKQEFEELKDRVRRKIPEICQENRDSAVYVVIGLITSRVGLPSERTFSESQLEQLFALADEYRNTPGSGNSTGAQRKIFTP